MDAESKKIVERAVNGAFADAEKYAPKEFKEILQADPQKKEAFRKAVKEAAEEELKLAAEFSKQTGTPEEVAECLKKHYPEHRLELVKTALQIPTYQLQIGKKPDGYHWVDITRSGKKFMDPVCLASASSINTSKWIQIASIVVEAILLVCQAVGIEVSVSESSILKTADDIIPVIENSSALQKAVEGLQAAVEGGSKWEIAKAIFTLIKDSAAAGILWKVIKGLCSNMSAWDWFKTAGIVSAMIIAAVATDGAALIAKIVLALNSAYEFIKKLTNMNELETISKTL